MKTVIQFECLIGIVRSQTQKCIGAGTFLFGNQAVPLIFTDCSLLIFKITKPTDKKKSISLVKHEEPKKDGYCETMLKTYDLFIEL